MKNPEFLDKATRASAVSDIMAPRANVDNRILGSSFRRVPSVVSFTINPPTVNTLLEGTGLDRNLPVKKSRVLHEGNNKHNIYMERQIKYLNNCLAKGKPKQYWMRAYWLLLYSQSFRLSAFNSVLSGWYKELPKARIYQILFGINHILKYYIVDLKFYRVNIPKGNPEEIAKFIVENPGKVWPGKTRPLGVPTAPWRIVLHLWNGFLTLFLEKEIKKYNHAYMPQVGTNTALKSWIQEVIPAKFVYEFDIKGFFNNVKITEIIKKLQERGMPFDYSLRLNLILNKVPANLELEESSKPKYDNDLKARADWGFLSPPKTGFTVIRQAENGNIAKMGIVERFGEPTPFVDFDPLGSGKTLYITRNDSLDKGLPQGAAPSTILSLLALSGWKEKLEALGIKLLMYADDGFLYSDQQFAPFPPEGFEFEESKSNWLKLDGLPVAPMSKFLGVTYDFMSGLLRGSTRNGSTLEFGPKQLEVLKFIQGKGYGSLTEALSRSGIWGLTLSKLYGGKWGEQERTQQAQYLPNSFWGSTFDVKLLSRDRALQRVASTIACEWLEKAIERSMTPKGVSLKELKEEEREWRRSQAIQINLKDLREAIRWDIFWTEKRERYISTKNIMKPYYGFFDPDNRQHVRVLKRALESSTEI